MSSADRARGNGRGKGISPEAGYLRELRAAHGAQRAARQPLSQMPGADCPECGEHRRTAETLRVHRWLAHGVKALAA